MPTLPCTTFYEVCIVAVKHAILDDLLAEYDFDDEEENDDDGYDDDNDSDIDWR